MRDNLFIRINTMDASSINWIVANKSRSKKTRQGTLKELAKIASNKRCILIVNGCDVLLNSTHIPTRNKQRLLKAIPFALEESLISDPDSQIFALAANNSNNQQAIAVIDRSVLTGLLELLKKHNIKVEIATPETLLLPFRINKIEASPTTWIVTTTFGKTIIRTGRYGGFCIDTKNVEALLLKTPKNGEDALTPEKVICIQTDSTPKETDVSPQSPNPWLDSDADSKIVTSSHQHAGDLLSLYARSFSESTCINLLQGKVKAQGQSNIKWKQWRLPAIAALMLVSILAVFSGFEYQAMSREKTALRKESCQLFKQALPSKTRCFKMRLQMTSKLKEIGRSDKPQVQFLDLLGLTGLTVITIKSLQLSTVNFRRGELIIQFTVDQANQIDILVQGLKNSGLKITRGASNKTTRGYTGTLRITAKQGKS